MAIKYYSGINISGNIVPSADSTFNLGGPAFYFANVYADNLYGDGSNITNIGAAQSALTLTVTVKNKSGGSLAKGTVVHAAPSANPPSGNVIEVIAADYDTVANMPGLGILNETLANDAEGEAVMFGAVSGIDTSSFLVGTELYVGNDGALTGTKPTATDQLIQKIAVVIKSSQNNGLIKVFGAGRTNDVPNKIDRTIQFDANQRFTDNSLILMGGGDMFQIGHKASYSQIATYEGNLYIDNNANDFDIVFRSDDGNGGLATYYYLDGSEGLNRFSKNILLPDDVNISLGNSFDLKLLHNGTDSYIDNSTGNLTIRNLADDSDVIISSDNGSGGTTQYFRADGGNGTVILYQYGNKRFETTSDGAKVTGDLEVTGNFTVSGTTTFIDTTHLNVGDNIITLNADLSGSTAPTENAGIAIYRGSSPTVSFEWDETNDIWTLGNQGLVADNLNITKENAAPTLNLLKGGNNPSTNELIGRLNFQTDYSGSPQDWARINVETNSSSVRTDMDFYVKSTSGALQTGLRLQGGTSTPKAFFYNDVNVDGGDLQVGNTTVIDSSRIHYANATASNTVPKYTFVGDTDTGLGYIGENSVGLIAQGSRKFYINNTDAYFQNLSGSVNIDSDLNVDGSTFKVDASDNRVSINGSISSNSRAYIFDSDSDPDTTSQGLWVRGVYSGTKSVAADHIKRGIYVDVDSSAEGTTTDEHMLFGIQVDARNSGLADAVTGVYSYVESNVTTQSHSYLRGGYFAATSDISNASGNVSEIRGIETAASIQDVGSFNNAFASYNRLEFTSTRNANNGASYGGYFEVEINNPNANSYGLMFGVRSVIDNNEGTVPSIGTSYLFYGDYQGTRAASNSWGIYVQGDKHYLEGKLGIGTTDLTTHALNVSGSGYISGGLTSNGTLSITGGSAFNTFNTTHTDRRLTINQNSGEYPRIYNYDEGDQTFHSIKIGGGNDETSGIVVDGSGNVTIHGTLDVSGTIDLSDANLDIGSADIIFGIDATDTGARGLIWNFDGDGDGTPVNIGYIRAGGTVVGEVMQFNMNSDGSVTGSGTIYQFMNGGTDILTVGREGNLSLRTTTNGVGSNINFSDHAGGSYTQQGNLTYFHADGASYGSGNAFAFTSTEASLTVLADGKLMFTEGLYIKPSSGTGGGTRIIDSSGNFYGGGANITSINASNISSGTLSGDRLPWANNDGFTGTYPLVWKASNTPYTASWLNVNGTTDTLHTRNINTGSSYTVVSSSFIDANDTSYYVNPSGASRLSQARFAAGHGDTRVELYYDDATSASNDAQLLLWASEPGISYNGGGIGANIDYNGQYYGRFSTLADYGVYMRLRPHDGVISFSHTTGTPDTSGASRTENFFVNASGNTQSRTSSRAPIFYDSDNTVYYTNPASTSNLNGLTLGGTLTLGSLTNNTTSTSALVNAGGGVVGQRSLGSAAFSNTSAFAPASHTHDDRYYTESESDSRFTSKDHFRSTGTGYYTSTTTSALLTEALGDGAFNSYLTAHKTGWSYAGNGDLTDAGRLTELAGTSWLWWTDNSTDGQQGNVTALCIAPNTGGSANKVFIYNNQGSSYAPGWREVWTSASDGSGSGLDADLLDGYHASSFFIDGDTVLNMANNDGLVYNDSNNLMYIKADGTDYQIIDTRGGTFSGQINASGGINMSNTNLSNVNHITINDAGAGEGIQWNGGNGWQIYESPDAMTNAAGNLQFTTGTTFRFRVDTSGNTFSSSSSRAPIFYDSDNTAYYLNAASTSRINRIDYTELHSPSSSNNGRFLNHSSWGTLHQTDHGYIQIGPANTGYAHIYTDRNSFYLNKMMYISGGTQLNQNDVRSKVFYDLDDTGYYVNPASTSNLNVVQAKSIRNDGSVSSDDGFGIYWLNTADTGYAIYREAGSWSSPFPDLRIAFYTGIKLGANKAYNGTRFYNNSNMSTQIASIGDGDDNMRSYYDIIAYASDKRLKTNVEPITNAIDKVKSLQGMTYNWNEVGKGYGWEPSEEREVGVFAQDVQAVLPEAVKLAPFDQDHDTEGNMYSKSGENFLTVKYEKIVPLLIEAIKEQQKQIDELKKLINP